MDSSLYWMGLRFHGIVYIELDRMLMYENRGRENQLLRGLYAQRHNARQFIRNERSRAVVRILQYEAEGRVKIQERRERGSMRPTYTECNGTG